MDLEKLTGDIHEAIAQAAGRRRFAVATILSDSGSTPRKSGTKAIIEADGSILGTIGGGQVEAQAQQIAIEAVKSGHPVVFEVAMAGDAGGPGPICGGKLRVLVDPTAGGKREAWIAVAEAIRQRRRGMLVTRIEHGPVVRTIVEWRPATAEEDDRSQSRPVSPLYARLSQEVEELSEPILAPPLLVIAGGGHVGQALALQGRLAGFAVTVIDDRPEFLAPALYLAGIDLCCADIAGELARITPDRDTYIAIVTRGHRDDESALAACIAHPAAYLGMIGSRRKVELVLRNLVESGRATPEQADRVFAPIGLGIGAQTVPEIAVSIVAQLIAVRRTGRAPRFGDALRQGGGA